MRAILPKRADVIIIGAGPAGLTAAYQLLRAGKSVVVLEAAPDAVGGISRTENYNGYRFDIGGHRFFSRAREVVAFWQEMLPQDFIMRTRISRIYYRGRFYHYPLRALEALRNLGLCQSALCLLSYLKWRIHPVTPPRSFKDWVSNQFGARLFEIFFRTYTEKVWGMRCEDISADWAAQRIKTLNLATAIKQALGLGGRGGHTPTSLIEQFHYPRLGPGMMWEAVRDKVTALGGLVQGGASVDRLVKTENGWQVLSTQAKISIEAEYVICSAALGDIIPVLEPAAQTRPQAEALKYRDFITVALILDQKLPLSDNWIYIHDPAVKVGRVQNYGAWSADMLANANSSCLGFEYFCFAGDGLWAMSDAQLLELATHELMQLGLAGQAKVIDGCVVRQPKAYPVYDGRYRENLQQIRAELEARYQGLMMVGRNGMHRYNNQDHSMLTAMLAVKNILAGKTVHDIWSVNEEGIYHESGSSGSRMVPEHK